MVAACSNRLHTLHGLRTVVVVLFPFHNLSTAALLHSLRAVKQGASQGWRKQQARWMIYSMARCSQVCASLATFYQTAALRWQHLGRVCA